MWIRDGKYSDPGWNKVGSAIRDKKIPDPQHWCFQGDASHICGAGCQLFSGDLATTSQPCHRQMGARRGGPSSQSYKTLQGNQFSSASDSAVYPYSVGTLDPYPDSRSRSGRAKMTHKHCKNFINFIFWSAGCSFLRTELWSLFLWLGHK